MKTITFVLAVTLAAAFGLTNKAFASATQTTFQISNLQADALGQVTVTTDTSNYFAYVGGNSTVPVQIAGAALSVTINNQVVPQGAQMNVTLSTGKMVVVEWTSSNSITVLDQGVLD